MKRSAAPTGSAAPARAKGVLNRLLRGGERAIDGRPALAQLALGAWLGLASIWPASTVWVGRGQLLWQPLLVASLAVLTVGQARRVGWAAAAGRSAYLYSILTLAAWLPWLGTIPSTPEFSSPRAYQGYLALYEAGLAALVGCQAVVSWTGRAPAWWPSGAWSRPLVAAPALLILRGVTFGHWISPVAGVLLGAGLAASRSWRWMTPRLRARLWQAAPWAVFACAVLVVSAAGMRLLGQLALDTFLLNSDDGNTYYAAALHIAQEPMWFLTSPEADLNFFSAYPPLMGLWFRLVGAHLPSWLVWQGVAAGLLAVTVYWLGRLLGSRTAGLVAAGLVTLDHVMVHLMATLNTETLMIPAFYGALWLWVAVGERRPQARAGASFVAGLLFGLTALFRPTVAALPFALACLLLWERPSLTWRQLRTQGALMLAGFGATMLLLLLRHRIAWGHWSLGQSRGSVVSWRANYAWDVQGQHPASVGFGPWLQVVAQDPSVIWREMLPDWWAQVLELWTHPGFGQMDLVQGLNHPGPYRAALAMIMAIGVVAGIAVALRRRMRGDLALCALPAYFTGLALVFYVINTRYRAPFIPALYLLTCLGWAALIAEIRSREPGQRQVGG
ncbi:MAG: glycosyltransferase family 39 protein [Candidatus Rokubacteria bacterium]|nr:glycosyltransferase family 39 protein [Candidatus Rokubacteria bacterium]